MIFPAPQGRTNQTRVVNAKNTASVILTHLGGELLVTVADDQGAARVALDHTGVTVLVKALDMWLDPGKYMEERP